MPGSQSAREDSPLDDPQVLAALVEVFLRDVDDGLILADVESQRFLGMNDSYCRMVGYSREELIGRTPFELDLFPHLEELENFLEAAYGSHAKVTGDIHVRRADGEVLLTEALTRFVEIDGRLLVFGIARDVTERRRAEEALRESEKRYRQLVESIPACVSLETMGTRDVLYVGPRVEDLLGYPLQDWYSGAVTWRDVIHPDDREGVLSASSRLDEDPERFTGEYRLVTADERTVWVRDESVPVPGADGERGAWLGFWIDITEQKEAERALREAEERYRLLVESMPAAVYLDRIEPYEVLYTSPRIEEMLGYPVADWRSGKLAWPAIVHPDDRERVQRTSDERDVNPAPYFDEYRVLASDGRVVWVRDQAVAIPDESGRPAFWQGLWVDITEQKEAELALREAEERYRVLVEALPAVVYLEHIDPPGVDYMSPRVAEMFGYPRQDWDENPLIWHDLIHPDERDQLLAEYRELMERPRPYVREFRMIARDGHVVWVRDQAAPIADDQGAWRRWQGFWVDITEQKEAELALREAEESYQVLVEALPAVVWLEHIDPPGTDYISPRVVETFGYPLQDWYDNNLLWRDLVHPDERDQLLAEYRELMERPRPYVREFRMIARDGHVVWVRDQAAPIADDQGAWRRWQGFWVDITEQREAEVALKHAEEERGELLARLVAAGEAERRRVAEDLHDAPIQSLTAAQLRLESLRDRTGGEDLALLDMSLEAVTASIRSLRSMMFDLQPRTLDRDGLEATLRAHLMSLSDAGGMDVAIRSTLESEPPAPVRSILYRIAQEALSNARKHARAGRVEVKIERAEDGYRLRIEDDGVGFDADADVAPGHSGLATMRDRAELSGGHLRVTRSQAGGTVVEAWVPGGEPDQIEGSVVS